MKKICMPLALGAILSVSPLCADDMTVGPSESEGFYAGVGGGVTFNATILSKGYYQDDTEAYKSDSLSDTSGGYIVYGGYQFNKIIAVEAAFTDYGSFSDTASKDSGGGTVKFSSDPYSFSVYANAGYTFSNGLRPFGQLGLGYLLVNGSSKTEAIGVEDGASVRFGLGLEYAPSGLSGLGFRVAYVEDVTMDFSYEAYDNGSETSTLLMNLNGMMYAGVQYKF